MQTRWQLLYLLSNCSSLISHSPSSNLYPFLWRRACVPSWPNIIPNSHIPPYQVSNYVPASQANISPGRTPARTQNCACTQATDATGDSHATVRLFSLQSNDDKSQSGTPQCPEIPLNSLNNLAFLPLETVIAFESIVCKTASTSFPFTSLPSHFLVHLSTSCHLPPSLTHSQNFSYSDCQILYVFSVLILLNVSINHILHIKIPFPSDSMKLHSP